jgi:hypothetical protein
MLKLLIKLFCFRPTIKRIKLQNRTLGSKVAIRQDEFVYIIVFLTHDF